MGGGRARLVTGGRVVAASVSRGRGGFCPMMGYVGLAWWVEGGRRRWDENGVAVRVSGRWQSRCVRWVDFSCRVKTGES